MFKIFNNFFKNQISKNLKSRFLFLFFFNYLIIFLELISISSIVPILLIFIGGGSYDQIQIPFLQNYFKFLIDLINNSSLIFIFFLIFLIFLIKFLLNLYYAYKFNKTSIDLVIEISDKLFKRYSSMSYQEHLKYNSSTITNYFSILIYDFVNNYVVICFAILTIFSTTFIYLIFLVLIDPLITLFLVISAFIVISIYYYLTNEKIKRLGKLKNHYSKKIFEDIKQNFFGFVEIKIYKAEKYFYEKFLNIVKIYGRNRLLFIIASKIPSFSKELGIVIGLGLIIFLSNYIGYGRNQTLAIISFYMLVGLKIIPQLILMYSYINKTIYGKHSASVITEELKFTNESNLIKTIEKNNSNSSLENLILEKISFSYDKKNIILNNINLKINCGSLIGISGPSGSGKTTLINIVMGLLKPDKGKIIINSEDILQTNTEWLARIGYVPQKLFLLDDSIKKNLLFGDKDDALSDESIMEVLEKVQLKDFVNNLPKKLHNKVGEAGSKISLGEIQRIAISRAILKNKDILILDEITSSLDEGNEEKIMNIVKNLRKNRIIILISHKQKTLKFCDENYNLQNGELKKI